VAAVSKFMRLLAARLVSITVCAAAGACTPSAAVRPSPARLPAVAGPGAPGLPPLPDVSPRIANYSIDARLDPERHTITGSLVLEWRNTSGRPLSSFPFHLYWNAFRNTLSTTARGRERAQDDRTPRRGLEDRDFGWIRVTGARLLAPADEDLLPTLAYRSEDGNADDRTVMELRSATAVPPEGQARFRIEWKALIPHGDVGRAGWVHDYHFIAQWFPKIGVFQDGAWVCHPFYPRAEFFADFGVYDVRLHLPRGFVVGATGQLEERLQERDGSESLHFVQEDVHDFAWTASRRFVERRARFEAAGYPPVEIRLLIQPEHQHLAERYISATKIALRSYGTWAAPYPYGQITVVDPAWGSASGGMEYPTLFTGGTTIFAPQALGNPEGVTIHEAGHQFWYGLVANDEAEEAWLDEGFNTYMTAKAYDQALGEQGWGRRLFADDFGRGWRTGWSFVAPGVRIARGAASLALLRANGRKDVMTRKAWEYRDGASYRVNSYDKPALVLQTLEGLLGEPTMIRVLRSYARRFRFAHPTTRDFIASVNETTGQDWGWFFEETFFSSQLCDYAVEVKNEQPPAAAGWFEAGDGRLELRRATAPAAAAPRVGRVTIVRNGGVRLPVELRVELADGRSTLELWDGRDRWKRFEYPGAKVVRAIVDPGRKLALDVDPSNNEWIADEGVARRAAGRWALRFRAWLQTLFELQTVFG
jgi:hypothetical protein